MRVGASAAPGSDVETGWRFARLLTAPHRLGFAAAALLMAVSALWWAAMLVARQAGLVVPWAVAPAAAHGLTLALSFMPLFIVGFLFTAGPRWLALPDVPARSLLRPVLAMTGGWLVAIPGYHVGAPLAAAGVALAASGWIVLLWRFGRFVRASRAPDRLHARGVWAFGTVGALAMLAAAAGLAAGSADLGRAAAYAALWGFLAPIFATVSHRMIPFFTASALPQLEAWRPNGLLAVMLAPLVVTAAVEVWQAIAWPLPPVVHAVALGVQAPAALLMLWLALRWGLVQSLRIRLLAMLHAGFVWLGVALALAALSHARVLAGGEGDTLGLAPLHALSMGYLGATMIAMTTRVAAGHSGRPLAADGLVWALYLVLHLGALTRVAAALWPARADLLTLLAAPAWTVACTGWAWRYGGWLGRPRVDGRAG